MTIWWYWPAEDYCIDDCIDKYFKHRYTQASALQHIVFKKVNSMRPYKQSVMVLACMTAWVRTSPGPIWGITDDIAGDVLGQSSLVIDT